MEKRQLSTPERHLKLLMQAWTVLFGFGVIFFLVKGDWILLTGNKIGTLFNLSPMPLPTERFWLSLTISLMVTLTALCFTIQKDVVANKHLTSFILISKFTSTVVFLIHFFIDAHYFNYLLGSVFCDGPILICTLVMYQRVKNYDALSR